MVRLDRLRLVLAAALLALAAAAPATARADLPHPTTLDRWLDAAAARGGLPAVSAVVLADGDVAWRGGSGADDPSSRAVFRVGSVTKVVTATAVLALRDRGVLDLDDPAAGWVPELRGELSPAGGAPVTLRHLLTHTSGIPRLGNGRVDYTRPGAELKAADVIASIRGATMSFRPGQGYEYSNMGGALLGLIASRAAGGPYPRLVERRVTGPLGMTGAAWAADGVPAVRRVAGNALDPATLTMRRNPPPWRLGAFAPMGGLYASADDLVLLARFWLGVPGPRVLAPATRRAALRDDPLPGPHGIGGWVVARDGVLGRHAFHNGATRGFAAALVVAPARDVAAIVLTSVPALDYATCLARELARAGAGREPRTCAVAPGSRALGRRLLVALRDPSPARIRATFTRAFLREVPVAAVRQTLTELRTLAGPCRSTRPERAVEAGALLRLDCRTRDLRALVAGDASTPVRIAALRALPAS